MASRRKKPEAQKDSSIFDDSSIPDGSVHDPYSDDGEYGSDKDFVPKDQENSSGDESIFDLRAVRRTQKHRSSGTESSEVDEDNRKAGVDDVVNDDTTDVETGDELFYQSEIIVQQTNLAQTHALNEENEQQLAETLNSDHAQEVFESDYAQELLESDHTQDPNEQPQENLIT